MRTVLVFERYIFKKDVAFDIGHLDSTFLVLDVRFDIKDLGKSLKTRITVLELLSKIHYYSDGFSERIYVKQECDKIRNLNQTFRDQYRARNDDGDIYQKDKCGHAGLEQAKVKITVLLGLQESVVAFLELPYLNIFICKRLNDSDAGQVVFSSGIDLGNLLPVLLKRPSHPLVKEENEYEHKRKHYECSRGKVLTYSHQDDERTDYLNERYDYILRSVMEKLSNIEEIISDPAHELSDLLVIEERERQLLIVFEDLGAHVVFHLRAHDMSDVRDIEIGQELHDNQHHQKDTETYDPLLRAFLHVDHIRSYITDYERYCQGYRRSHNSKEHIQKECSYVRLIVAYEFSKVLKHSGLP